MKKINIVLFAVLIGTAMSVEARNGIYATLETGWAQQSGLPSAAQAGASNVGSHTFPSAYRAGVGYNHDIWDCFGIGLDIGAGSFGKETYVYTSNQTNVTSSTLEFLAFGQYHFTKIDVIGKLGGIRQTVHISGQDSQPDQTQIRTQAVLGAAYNINEHVAVTADYTHVFGQSINSFSETQNQAPSLNEVMAGLRYIF